MLRATVAIPAHNEAAFLPEAVASAMAQALPADAYEVVVIDNASTDGTADVLAELSARFPSLRVIAEPVLGLCHARNRGLREARSDVVAFMDADAVVDRGWLAALLDVFAGSERIGAVGGPIEIRWDHPRPAWWDERLAEALNEYAPAPTTQRLEYPRYPYGTNLAVRVAAALTVGGFKTTLDRQGTRLLGGGDGELCLNLDRAGWETWYAPAASVGHRTAAGRLSRRYILRRALNHGRSQHLIEHLHGFESGRYLSWPGIAARIASTALRFRLDLPFLKFIAFRIGYQWQRSVTRGQRRAAAGKRERKDGARAGARSDASSRVNEQPG